MYAGAILVAIQDHHVPVQHRRRAIPMHRRKRPRTLSPRLIPLHVVTNHLDVRRREKRHPHMLAIRARRRARQNCSTDVSAPASTAAPPSATAPSPPRANSKATPAPQSPRCTSSGKSYPPTRSAMNAPPPAPAPSTQYSLSLTTSSEPPPPAKSHPRGPRHCGQFSTTSPAAFDTIPADTITPVTTTHQKPATLTRPPQIFSTLPAAPPARNLPKPFQSPP